MTKEHLARIDALEEEIREIKKHLERLAMYTGIRPPPKPETKEPKLEPITEGSERVGCPTKR